MRSRVDHGRSEVYAAERQAFMGTGVEEVRPFDELQQLFAKVVGSPWWPHPVVRLRRSRSDAFSSVARFRAGQAPAISLARDQMTVATLIHELAHVLAGHGAGHGPVFRRAQLDLTACWVGVREAEWLRDAYSGFGLSIGSRHWSTPPSQGGPIAL
jgi:hypothetical protein